ncbi:MAG TPA: transcription elongation factor GreA [Thermodesulfovibrionia bacterium]|nr:transcription elongation factor GreA [Thermodesulfovibrionia bacterium]
MKKIPMTPSGYQKLKEELSDLIKVERPKNIKDIEEARAHGDLKENAEYSAAKERQSFIEGRTRELQAKIALAEVIDPSSMNHSHIAFGATVKLLDTDTEEEKVYTLVGEIESDVKAGKISVTSPVARSLIGKKVGNVATVKTPAKTIEYEILEIKYE